MASRQSTPNTVWSVNTLSRLHERSEQKIVVSRNRDTTYGSEQVANCSVLPIRARAVLDAFYSLKWRAM